MKRTAQKLIFPFLFITLVINGCTKNNSVHLNIIVVKEFKLNEEAQEQVHSLFPIVVDNPYADEIALSNYRSPKNLILINYKGELIDKFGKEGRGPGELLNTSNFGFDSNQNPVVLDEANAFFNYFDRTTKAINSYEYPIKKGLYVTSSELQSCNEKWYMGVQLLGEPTNTTVPTIAVVDSTFTVIDSLGGYDPFFKGRTGIYQQPVIKVDCEGQQIFTTHSKTPFIQVLSLPERKIVQRTSEIPPSFMLSDTFISMVTNRREMIDFLSDEQSTTLGLAVHKKYIFHIFRNELKVYTTPKNLNDSNYFVAVYDREKFKYIGETKLPGAILGSTKTGSLILLKDEKEMIFQFIDIVPSHE